jgi:hypothetical protein
MSFAPSSAGTEPSGSVVPLTTADIIRAYEAIEHGDLYRAFEARLPYERIGAVWRAMDPGRSDTSLNVRTCLWAWVRDRYAVGPKGTYAILRDFPEYPVSLMCGGIFYGWGEGRKTAKWGIFLTAALIFRILPDDFPALLEIVAGTIEGIASGAIRIPEVSVEEIRAYLGGIKEELLPIWTEAGLVTTVLRKAPTARKLWLALPPELRSEEGFETPKELIYFLRKCEKWENETVVRVTERTDGHRNVLWLLEVTELR